MARIHATSVVEPGAKLHESAVIGPFCYIGDAVEIGAGTVLISQATVFGPTRLGAQNQIFPFAVLGAAPQDKSHGGEPTVLEIGDDNVFREQVTVHRGTKKGGGVTHIGSRCLFMVGAHVAHDALVDDDVVLTNFATLGGHVRVRRAAVLGGHAAIAPFTELGRMCFVAGGARVERPVPPFVIAAGDRARVRALNRVGLRRGGVPEASRRALARAFAMIWRSDDVIARGAMAARAELGHDPFVAELVDAVLRMLES